MIFCKTVRPDSRLCDTATRRCFDTMVVQNVDHGLALGKGTDIRLCWYDNVPTMSIIIINTCVCCAAETVHGKLGMFLVHIRCACLWGTGVCFVVCVCVCVCACGFPPSKFLPLTFQVPLG